MWDANRSEAGKLNQSYPCDLHNVLSTEKNSTQPESDRILPGFNQPLQIDPLSFHQRKLSLQQPNYFTHQDSSRNTFIQPTILAKPRKSSKQPTNPVPIQIKFQELKSVVKDKKISR